MTDTFTEAVNRQLQAMGNTINNGIQQTGQDIAGNNGDGNTPGFSFTPQQVASVIQGNNEWMQQFEQTLEQSFARLGNRIVQNWMNNTDRELRRSIGDEADSVDPSNSGGRRRSL